MKTRKFSLILIVSAGFTVFYMVYGLLNISVSYNIDKEYTGIVFEDDNLLTVKIKGTLEKRLFSINGFSGNIEFLDGDSVTEYSLSLNESEQVTEIGDTGWHIGSINRKALFGIATDRWRSGNSKTIAVLEMISDWKQIIIILFEDANKRFIVPANNLEEPKQVKEEFNLKIWK